MTTPPAGWHPDPTGRHELRYSDGAQWTEHVANDQVTAVDPYTAPVPPPPAPPVPPPAAAPAPAAQPAPPSPDPTTPVGGWSQPTDSQHSPTAETPVTSEPAAGWPDYGQAPAAGSGPADTSWSAIDAPIAPDPTTSFPAPPVGQAAGAPTSFQAPPAYAAPPPGAVPTTSPVESSGGTRWGLIALIVLLVVGVIGVGVVVASNLSDDGGGDGVADDPAVVIPEFGEDAQLDNLARACQNGDWDSCDDLYYQSGFGSGYEDYGNTCGGRNAPTQEYCANRY